MQTFVNAAQKLLFHKDSAITKYGGKLEGVPNLQVGNRLTEPITGFASLCAPLRCHGPSRRVVLTFVYTGFNALLYFYFILITPHTI